MARPGRRGRGRASAPPDGVTPRVVTVLSLGHRGDGVARPDADGPVFVPLTLPGDRARVRIAGRDRDGRRADLLALETAAPRVEPPCPHFGVCGGCRVQHAPAEVYAAWRREQLRAALRPHGLADVPVLGPLPTPPGARRRLRLAFRTDAGRTVLGFRARGAHRIVDVTACPIARPELAAALPATRSLLAGLDAARPGGEVRLTATAVGLDVEIAAGAPPGLADRERVADHAATHDLARVAWRTADEAEPEVVVERRRVTVDAGGVAAFVPPGAFLQASDEAEARLRDAVLRHAVGARRAADLFAGCGAFGLPLARSGVAVHAFEAAAPMVGASLAAARAAGLGDRFAASARDLYRAPLTPAELAAFDLVVLDPPRAGARAQAEALAASGVARAVMVSCHPASFARDAAILARGGLVPDAVTVVDAFLWSDRTEAVAAFTRKGAAKTA